MSYSRKLVIENGLVIAERFNSQDNWYNKYNKARTPTWTTLLLDYAIKVVHYGEFA